VQATDNEILDAYLILKDIDGSILAENDDNYWSLNPSISKQLTSGTYEIEVRSYQDLSGGEYVLHIEEAPSQLPVNFASKLWSLLFRQLKLNSDLPKLSPYIEQSLVAAGGLSPDNLRDDFLLDVVSLEFDEAYGRFESRPIGDRYRQFMFGTTIQIQYLTKCGVIFRQADSRYFEIRLSHNGNRLEFEQQSRTEPAVSQVNVWKITRIAPTIDIVIAAMNGESYVFINKRYIARFPHGNWAAGQGRLFTEVGFSENEAGCMFTNFWVKDIPYLFRSMPPPSGSAAPPRPPYPENDLWPFQQPLLTQQPPSADF
jgi:hypothetical protein